MAKSLQGSFVSGFSTAGRSSWQSPLVLLAEAAAAAGLRAAHAWVVGAVPVLGKKSEQE